MSFDFMDVSLWILGAAVAVWSIERRMPWVRFKIRISVVLFSVALFPLAYAIVYPGAEVVFYMAMTSPIFLILAAFALRREQEEKDNKLATFKEYLSLAEGDKDVAWKFMRKAHTVDQGQEDYINAMI